MPKNLPAKCKVCGARRRDGVHISRNGLCEKDALANLNAAHEASRVLHELAKAGQPLADLVDRLTAPPRGGGGTRSRKSTSTDSDRPSSP